MIIEFLRERKNVFQIIIVSIILAFGVRFIGQGLSEILGFKKVDNIYIGLIFVFFAASFFAISLFKQKEKEYKIRGFFIYNKSDNKLLKVQNYEFGEKLKKYFDSAFAENKGLEKVWEKHKIDDFKTKAEATTGRDLLYQATEYFFINKLSFHLMAYFNPTKFKSSKLKKFDRTDIPQVLFQNTFLDLFSKPMDMREAFVDEYKSESKNPDFTLLSSESNGHLYENLNLTLPKKCTVTKPEKNTLEIKTNRIELGIKTEITGMNSNIPENFLKYYIGESLESDFIYYTIGIDIKIKFTLLAFFTNLGWKYFRWIDSFLEIFIESFSERRFYNRINWETIDNLINVTKELNKEK